MADVKSIAIAAFAVSFISGLGFVLSLKKDAKIKSLYDLKEDIAHYDIEFDPCEILISEDKDCAIITGQDGKKLIAKVFGNKFVIRKIENENIQTNNSLVRFRFNDLSFKDFSAIFAQYDQLSKLENKAHD
jgi:hypothetical protein